MAGSWWGENVITPLIYVFFYLHKNLKNSELALFSTLALVAAIPSSILCLTLRWELLEDIFLKKKNAKKYIPKKCHKQLKLVNSK